MSDTHFKNVTANKFSHNLKSNQVTQTKNPTYVGLFVYIRYY